MDPYQNCEAGRDVARQAHSAGSLYILAVRPALCSLATESVFLTDSDRAAGRLFAACAEKVLVYDVGTGQCWLLGGHAAPIHSHMFRDFNFLVRPSAG